MHGKCPGNDNAQAERIKAFWTVFFKKSSIKEDRIWSEKTCLCAVFYIQTAQFYRWWAISNTTLEQKIIVESKLEMKENMAEPKKKKV